MSPEETGASQFKKPPKQVVAPTAPRKQTTADARPRQRPGPIYTPEQLTRFVLVGLGATAFAIALGVVSKSFGLFLALFLVGLVLAGLFARDPHLGNRKTEMYCPNCGVSGVPQTIVKGSLIAELVLWLFFLLPGVIYSIWRFTSRHEACPSCRQAGMIPSDSPRALMLKRKVQQ